LSTNPFAGIRWVWMNGELRDFATATIHVMSHALHYGSGLFEGIRCYQTSEGPAVFRLQEHLKRLEKRPFDYFKMFVADTALFGARDAMECGLAFFGADQVVFASDFPFDPEKGTFNIRETIRDIDGLKVSDADRKKIYEGNARRLLKM